MAENLKTSKFNDATLIPNVTANSQWKSLTSEAWSYYNNDITYNEKYGKLYNWYVVSSNKNICPLGWHIPKETEWRELIDFLGGETFSGNKLKEVGTNNWNDQNSGVTNSSGFSALPGGYRDDYTGVFYSIGYTSDMWSSNQNVFGTAAYVFQLHTSYSYSKIGTLSKNKGLSIRCIRD